MLSFKQGSANNLCHVASADVANEHEADAGCDHTRAPHMISADSSDAARRDDDSYYFSKDAPSREVR